MAQQYNMTQQWYTLKNGHSLTKEILSGLRGFYDAVDLPGVQQDVDACVRAHIVDNGDEWSQQDYLRIKVPAENIINNAEMLIQNEEED